MTYDIQRLNAFHLTPSHVSSLFRKEQIMGAELGRLNNELQKMQGQMAAKDAHVRQSEEIRRSQEAKTSQYDQQIKQYEQQLKQYEAGSVSSHLGCHCIVFI